MNFPKSGKGSPTSPTVMSFTLPHVKHPNQWNGCKTSMSSIPSTIGSASSLALNTTPQQGGLKPLTTSSDAKSTPSSTVKEVLSKLNNGDSNRKDPFITSLKKSSNDRTNLSPRGSYADSKAFLAQKFRSEKPEPPPRRKETFKDPEANADESFNINDHQTGSLNVSILMPQGSATELQDFEPNHTPQDGDYGHKQDWVPEPVHNPVSNHFRQPKNVDKPLRRVIEGYVGIANLPNQIYKKSVKRGFEFTLMVVGESGLGKSTLLNSLFLTDIYSDQFPGPSDRIQSTVQVESAKILLQESGVDLKLTIVDSPGFGDAIDNSNCWDPIVNYIEAQYEKFMNAETRVNRVPIADCRVHACLYFIAPSVRGLKPLDIKVMQKLQDKVNIIPVIGKADTLTKDELTELKSRINEQISSSGIQIYKLPEESSAVADEDGKREYHLMKDRVPFAVVGSNAVVEIANGNGGRKIRVRKYPWGIVEVENDAHSDFVTLRNILIRTNLLDLIDVTHNVMYENFRWRKLASIAGLTMDRIRNKNPLAALEEEKMDHDLKLAKTETEMEEVFQKKVTEKIARIEATQIELETKSKEAKEKLESEKKELEQKRRAFLEEKRAWEAQNNARCDDVKRKSSVTLAVPGRDLFDGEKKSKTLSSSISFRLRRS